MVRATKSTKAQDTRAEQPTATPTSDQPTSEIATTDERDWMLDLFDWPSFFGRPWFGRLPARLFDIEPFFGDRLEETFPMRVEQFRDGDELVVRAELPGIDPDQDVEIGIEGRRLTIDATRESRTEAEDGHRSEFRYGKFHRSMTLPKGADADHVHATYADGILEVRIPIETEAVAAKKVEVTRG